MWTIQYKGYYIHGYNDQPECTAAMHIDGYGTMWQGLFKSLQAAKVGTTRHIKKSSK